MSKIKARTCFKYVSAFCAIEFVISFSVFADTLGSWVIPTTTSSVTSISSSANLCGDVYNPA